ncbi:pyruvate synthase subunit PorB [Vulcanisaeta souniana]|uniref:2-oxoacid oxidoreductase (ferredoxin) n=1 Tax=Vulcanisaeta souniana JCM 11219 TaxID=1293586 RepID=A0A830EGD2_9CREN|nr:pyruvate synthase subunit PorB [Vulcanisaeta souniana]BDR91560.1 thiamine pyrophosphate-binding domain-containing protein [Vulcanisaeta souniana JCM 11219]GGI74130.1 thiamine pyrophosphate-binding domain-containing protein [Vulcanisaeta souniana JCM 11219]
MKVYFRTIKDLPVDEYFGPGQLTCAGCGPSIAIRWILKAAGSDVIIVNATGCIEVTSTSYPYTAWSVPYLHVAFENAAAAASGAESALKVLRRKGMLDAKAKVIAIAGDGGTYDIGLQALSGMLERGHGVLYVLYDNEAYMNTGIQRSGGTPHFAWTTTSPVGSKLKGKVQRKKDIMSIVIGHHIPYAATANLAYPIDLANKVKTALDYLDEGPAFIHVLAPCPPGWRYPEEMTVEIARLATETGYFPLYEWDHGMIRFNPPSNTHFDKSKRKPITEYLKRQGRFAHLTEENIKEIEKEIDEYWDYLSKLVKTFG